MHSFISDYDPDCMVMTQCDSGELQSALASKFGRFPSELFGGDSDSSAISLRAMFGFSIAHAQGSSKCVELCTANHIYFMRKLYLQEHGLVKNSSTFCSNPKFDIPCKKVGSTSPVLWLR